MHVNLELQLDQLDHWPEQLHEVPAVLIERVLPHPTLIHIPGIDQRPVFLSVLLHGDEDVGLKAIQQVMSEYRHAPLPRAISLLIGNVRAATQTKRTLVDQLDFNRVWFGSELPTGPEHRLMEKVVATMVQRRVAASIDLHNNSGRNPYYACICSLESQHLQLASLFSDKTLYFQRPKGVQTQAFMSLCPAITCECGPIGDAGGVRAAADLIHRVLGLGAGDLSQLLPPVPECTQLYHTVATWRIRHEATLSFDSRSQSHVCLRPDLDRLNFMHLTKSTEMGQLQRPLDECLQVVDQAGVDVTDEYFEVDALGALRVKRDVLPSMLTTSLDAIRLDCVGYLMERLTVR